MADTPAHIRNLKHLTRSEPRFDHIEAIESELYGLSDRAAVIMLGSMVEVSLRRLFGKIFRVDLSNKDQNTIFEYEGALGSFASKISVAYALKLLGPISRNDLDLIRILRNEFAHSRMTFGFNNREVQEFCGHLRTPELPESMIPHGYLKRLNDDERRYADDKSNPKSRFICACHTLAYRMIVSREDPREGDFVFQNDDPLP